MNLRTNFLLFLITLYELYFSSLTWNFHIYTLSRMGKQSVVEPEEFERAKNLLSRTSRILSWSGSWPMTVATIGSRIKFALFILYYGTYLCMEYADLITLLGNFEMIVMNLMESGLQSIIMFKILVIKFNKFLRYVVTALKDEMTMDHLQDAEEVELFIRYNASAENFHRIMIWLATVTAFSWYLLPLQNYLISTLQNETAILETPYRINTFFDISSMDRTIGVYIYQFPILYTSVCYASMFGVTITLINNICAHIAILAHRIEIMGTQEKMDLQVVFRHLIEKHGRILEMTKNLDMAFQLVLFFELIMTTVLIALLTYTTMLNFDDAAASSLFTTGMYALTMILLIYVNCHMGEGLQIEGTKLHEAIYHCEWYNMSASYKKGLIICMIQTQIPLQMTAGKFYVFSLENFTNIIKSSLAYTSMLRTMI